MTERTFRFPLDISDFSRFSSSAQLRESLKRDLIYSGVRYQLFGIHDICDVNVKKIYLNCIFGYKRASGSKCNSTLIFEWKQEEKAYVLREANNLHVHSVMKTEKRGVMRRYLLNLPQEMPIEQKWNRCNQISKIAFGAFKCVYIKLMANPIPSRCYAYLQQLPYIGYSYQCLPEDKTNLKDPDIILISSKEMKSNFLKYGQVAYFQSFEEVIKVNKDSTQPIIEQWSIFVLEGRNQYNNPIPFAFSLEIEEKKQDFGSFFRLFFEKSKRKNTTIISNFSQGLARALQSLKKQGVWSGNLEFRAESVRENMLQNISNIELKSKLSYLLDCKSEQESSRLWKQCQEKAEGCDALIFQKFQQYSPYFCRPLMKVGFRGINGPAYAEDSIKIEPKMFQDFNVFEGCVGYFLKHIEKISDRSKQDTNSLDSDKNSCPLKSLKYEFGSSVMHQFSINFDKSLSLKFVLQGSQWKFESVGKSDIEVIVTVKSNMFDCSCRLYDQTGIPCPHIVAVSRSIGIDPFALIHKRWRIQGSD